MAQDGQCHSVDAPCPSLIKVNLRATYKVDRGIKQSLAISDGACPIASFSGLHLGFLRWGHLVTLLPPQVLAPGKPPKTRIIKAVAMTGAITLTTGTANIVAMIDFACSRRSGSAAHDGQECNLTRESKNLVNLG